MRQTSFSPLFVSIVVILSMQACVFGPLGSGAAPGGGLLPAGGNAGACSNPWEPVVTGASWNYAETGIDSGSYVRTIESVGSDSFSMHDVFSNGTNHTTQWKCDQGALTAVDPFSADVASSNGTFNMQTTSTDGTGMPASMKPGGSFAITYHMSGTMTDHGKTGKVKEDVSESCSADGMQDVTVAAGSFNALHLNCQLGLTMQITVAGSTFPQTSTSQAQRWYATGVGLVKSTDQSNAGLREVDLTSYKIP